MTTVPDGARVPSHARPDPASLPGRIARSIVVEGVVQGVGFRPFVWRLAHELALDGVVRNAAGRVEIEVAGPCDAIDAFIERLTTDAPPRARVERVVATAPSAGYSLTAALVAAGRPGAGFTIEESVAAASAVRLFPPDIATCDECLRELADPADRRYRYPFINCTNCGPRATIIEALPYDRAQTSMREFPLCAACEAEYRDPADRRFHAEPVACPACGPRLAFRRPADPAATAVADAALEAAIGEIEAGRVVAVKGLGGYHLACDATDGAAVSRLRDRKHRWAKPFAVMVRDLPAARAIARLTARETELLISPARPIVLATLRADAVPAIAPEVLSGNHRIGLFLPYTPLHHLLLEAIGRPIVLTSGNLSDEPLVTDDEDALVRLAAIADAFLVHDRRILARYDDSVTRVVGRGRATTESIIRRGRGYAPEPLPLPIEVPAGDVILAAGAELKHTFALAAGPRAHVGPHIGDLEDLDTHRAFEGNLAHLETLLALQPEWVAHDLHPAYLSTQYAARRFPATRRIAIQHHHAHVASCAAEHGITEPFLGVAYDGLGMGDDGTFWGGELLVADLAGYRRFARFARAPMPGGSAAVRRPYRMALGYLFGAESFAPAEDEEDARRGPDGIGLRTALADGAASGFLARLDPREVAVVRIQVARRLNAPLASSAGRLFDAVSSLLGLRDVAEYEAQAAIDLEMAADPRTRGHLPYGLDRAGGLLVYDPRPTLAALLEGVAAGTAPRVLAARFQATIVAVTRELCAEARRATGIEIACLSGGVFQNRTIADALLAGLARDGFDVRINQRVPVNDGGICYGQAAIAAARRAGRPGDLDPARRARAATPTHSRA